MKTRAGFFSFAGVLVALTLFFGQACQQAFEPNSELLESSSSYYSSYALETEKADCASSAPQRDASRFATMGDLVDYMNELPKPVQLHCLILNLPRPLQVQVGMSPASAQPSTDEKNPRILIKVGQLILSFVPDSPSPTVKNSLEIGALKNNGTSATRADYHFPLDGPTPGAAIDPAVGLEHIVTTNVITGKRGTSCGVCHNNEAAETEEIGGESYRNDLIPFRREDRRSLSKATSLANQCVETNDPSDRCRLLRSLLDGDRLASFEF